MELYQIGILAIIGFFVFVGYQFLIVKPIKPIITKSFTPFRKHGGNNIPSLMNVYHPNRRNKKRK